MRSSRAHRLVDVVRARPLVVVGGTGLVVIVVCCALANVFSPYNPTSEDISTILKGPSSSHLMGTDSFGRDVFSLVLYGGRPTLLISAGTVALASVIGVPIGMIAGFYGRATDLVLMRVAELGFVLPPLILAIALVAAFGVSDKNVVLALGIVFFPIFARVARASTLTQRQLPYVEAALLGGEGGARVIVTQILPNIGGPVIVQAVLAFAYAILSEASLSFLGLGTQPPLESWGRMLSDATLVFQTAPWVAIFPGVAIALTVLCINLLGDGIRDVLDPTRLAGGWR